MPQYWPRSAYLPFCVLGLFLFQCTTAFYVPGYSIRSYRDDENIPLLVNKIYSDHTQLQYAYFDLPFTCPPSGKSRSGSSFVGGQSLSLNLGEVLRGDRLRYSEIEVNMGQDVQCHHLCRTSIRPKDLKWTQQLIDNGYVAEWVLDNLPGATRFVTVDRKQKYYAAGFKIGSKDYDASTRQPVYYLNNHLTLVVRWRRAPGNAGDRGQKVVVGFEVYPESIREITRTSNETCSLGSAALSEPFELRLVANKTDVIAKYPDSSYIPDYLFTPDEDATLEVPYSYSVYFREENEVEWANRWDFYFSDQAEGTWLHWLAIVNSSVIASICGALCVVVWIRTTPDAKVRGDKSGEEGRTQIESRTDKGSGLGSGKVDVLVEADSVDDEILEDGAAWKLLHGDVFRTPAFAGLLAPLVGSGVQLVFMVAGLLVLSCLGVLNPSWRGGFITVGVALFVVAGGVAGYFSARIYRTFDGQNWRRNSLITALFFPGLIVNFVLVLNMFTWAQASSTAIPFSTLMLILFLWLCIQVPLVYSGAFYGFHKAEIWTHPTRTASVPRQIPTQPWYNRRQVGVVLLSGLVPFLVLFIELLSVLKSMYLDKSSYYYVFGFLSINSALLTVVVAEMAIITTYVQLNAENYHWWWQSFLVGGSSAVWIFAYSGWYYATRLHIEGFVSSLLFFSYTALACAVYGLATGTIGFVVAYAFVRRIYGAVKVD